MEKEITKNIEYMSDSHHEMAKIMKVQKHVVEHMSSLITDIPDVEPIFGEFDACIENSLIITRGVSAYLNSLADLEDAMTGNLRFVLREMREQVAEE